MRTKSSLLQQLIKYNLIYIKTRISNKSGLFGLIGLNTVPFLPSVFYTSF